MDACISIVGSLAGIAAEHTVDPIAQQLGYLFKHKNKFQDLRSKIQNLKDARERVLQSVVEANRNGEEIFGDVNNWLTLVNDKISDEAMMQLQEDEEKAMKHCFSGFCPAHLKSRYQLSKKAEKEAEAIAQLLVEKDGFSRVAHRPALEVIEIIRPVKEFEAFGSRSGALNEVMSALEDDNFNIIGVHGMGGVGKTTLVKEVARIAEQRQLFDEVVLVAITQTPDMMKTQDEIAEKLGLTIEERNMDMRAARLRDRLKKNKKVLLILDDLWETVDFEEVGVPSIDEHKGCKILMTSRKLDVLQSMNSQPNLPIDILEEDEAWNLFKKVAGHIVERPDLKSVALKVAQKCAGLPIAITTVAKALKNKQSLHQWQDALERELSGAVYSAIKMSFKYLEREELQSTFLLCSTMRHNAVMEDLVKHCSGLGFFSGLDTIAKVRNRVMTVVSELKDSSLLLAGSTPERFDIHDVVRDVAISIASRDRGWVALGKEDVSEVWSDEDKMRNCNLVSLQYAKFSELPDELECPNLRYLSMYCSKDSSVVIPSNFLKGMQRLKVLDFATMHLSSLPSSIGFLKTLSTLCLSGCKVKDVVVLGELANLEILDLRRSRVEMLPKEIGQLSRLKLLDLSDCYNLKVISPNVLSRLSRLEELYLYGEYGCFDGWEVEGGNERRNASVDELQHLCHLTTLELHIPDVRAIPKDTSSMFFGNLERFKISIGQDKWRPHERRMETSRMLKLRMKKKSIHLVHGVTSVLRKVESLYVDGVDDLITEGFPHLKHLRVVDVGDIKVVINSMMLASCLESLSLASLSNLEAICCDHAQLSAESFGRLRSLSVHNSNKMKNLLSLSVAKVVCRQLEEIVVSRCENMRELIMVKKEEFGSEDPILEFTQLHSLYLFDLPTFKGLWSSSEITLQSVTWVFDQKVLFPAIKELHLEAMDSINKIWHVDDDQIPPIICSRVGSLTTLRVESCPKLKYVFSSSMVKSFVHLKTLRVLYCHEMEDIVQGILGGGGENEQGRISSSSSSNISTLFPKLDALELYNLPKLKRFCCGINIAIEFPSLRQLSIHSCPVLKTFVCSDGTSVIEHNISLEHNIYINNVVPDQPQYLFNQKVILPVLEELYIVDMDNLERLWPNQLAEHSFSKLTYISLIDCGKLLLSMLTRFQGLKKLRIWNCESVEEIIFETESQVQEEGGSSSSAMDDVIITTIPFPCLKSLTLDGLQNLKRIHTTKWPLLEKMKVRGCEKVEILFGCEESIPIQQPLFWVNQFSFPNLHKLTLGWNPGMKETIWLFEDQQQQQQLESRCFRNLKQVVLSYYPEEVTILPSYLFHLLSLPSLQTLAIRECYFKEMMIFQSEEEGGEEKPASVWTLLSNITELSLYNLPQLLHLCKEKEGFRNLVSLSVDRCDGIIRLITHSTAKTLVHLKKTVISHCKKMEEIIQGGDDDQGDEICFPQLNTLRLANLPKLESFCSSGNYTFRFPSLETVIVCDCPKMEMFSKGDSNTPILHQVTTITQGQWVGLNRERWEGSLNTTIQQFFREQNDANAKKSENSEQDHNNPSSTSNTQNDMTEETDISEQVQTNSSTSNAQKLLEEGLQISIKDEVNQISG